MPSKETCIEAGDTVILYGRDALFAELTERPKGPAGDQAHHRAVAAQHDVAEHEEDREQGRVNRA